MTWTLQATLALASRNVTHDGYLCTNADASRLYLVSGQNTKHEQSFIIWEINTSTWAATNISSSEAWSGSNNYSCMGIAFFDGNVYIVVEDNSSGNDTYVYVWDGTGTTTWTLSKTLTDYDGNADPTSNPGIGVDSNYLYATTSDGAIPSSAGYGVFRFDGSTWYGPDEYSAEGDFERSGRPYGLEFGAGADIDGAVLYVSNSTFRLANYNGTTGDWEPIGAQIDSDLDAFRGGNSKYTFWYKNDNYIVTSADYGETYNADGSLIAPYGNVWPLDNNFVFGCTGADDESHIINTASSIAFELHDTLPALSGHVIRGFWTDGTTLYCVADNDGGTGCRLYSNTLPVFENRLLGIATDGQNVFITGNYSGTLKLSTYQLHPDLPTALVNINSVSAGAATYAELDNRTKGIFPVCKLGGEIVYLRGLDGEGRQVTYSDDTGSTLTDLSDSWSTKYAVALLIDPLNPTDIIVPFDDNDIYQTIDGGENWTKVADADVNLREAARNLIDELQLLLAGQSAGAGELFWTPNLGVSTEDVSDAGLDVINHIEPSL